MNSKGKSLKFKKALNQASTFTQQEKLLKNQTNKIQDKLETLKAEIAMRKTMKNKQKESQTNLMKNADKNNTATTFNMTNKMNSTRGMIKNQNQKINKFLLGNNPKKTIQTQQVSHDKQNLQNLLQQLKMQHFSQILIQKYNINTIDKLLSLSEDDIDNWKQIPIGFRIKMKKFINQHIKNLGGSPNKGEGEQKKQKQDIQAIIQRRKNQRIYEPINDKKIEQQEDDILAEQPTQFQEKDQNDENNERQQKVEDEQDILISSLNSAFMLNQRRGIIKKPNNSNIVKSDNNNNKVHWNKNVKQYNKQTSKFVSQKYYTKYPNNEILQQLQQQQQKVTLRTQNQKANYCWNCLKKIKVSSSPAYQNNDYDSKRQFCSINCLQTYKMSFAFQHNLTEPQKVITIQQNKQKIQHKNQSKQQLDILDLSII